MPYKSKREFYSRVCKCGMLYKTRSKSTKVCPDCKKRKPDPRYSFTMRMLA